MAGTAYIFAHIDLDTMNVRRVSIMSDSNPTCLASDSYLLITKVQEGENYNSAYELARTYLLPGGSLHMRWYEMWDERQAEIQRERHMQNIRRRQLEKFWNDTNCGPDDLRPGESFRSGSS